ncbi:hypothetical protein fugu_005801 [Takifugu bimaculatus]|uniref:E3 ubiquitin ligase TRAF3IP2 n=1 Tax=Takifugu bimaculatus TaxID=433685 RepID=A0A4Z2B990_9TELE|nr:hypothetical protein fugu_005801 [Takifugu bimaculatus]
MMMTTSVSAPSAPERYLESHYNLPEEHDETMSTLGQEASNVCRPAPTFIPTDHSIHPEHPTLADDSSFGMVQDAERGHYLNLQPPGPSYFSYPSSHSFAVAYGQPTPFPSQANSSRLHPSFASSWSGYPKSLPSYLSQMDFPSSAGSDCLSGCRSLSLPGSTNTSSLEQPLSLCSNPPSANLRHHNLPPYSCPPQGAGCCAQCPAEAFSRRAAPNKPPWPQHHPANDTCYPGNFLLPGLGCTQMGHKSPSKQNNHAYSTPLSLEQRRVFITYEADNDKHVNDVINFAALLRHNGFDTHIDVFEQQLRSISKIDFMERFLSEKGYLIIIIISPKYYETVTASPLLANDERTFNTVYIHKQLQNEFIQNGSKNFRFIPILFPGATKCHVPSWLQNTHIYRWPRDREDILRRLMRVEKYNPPPIGPLPTIISIPI